MAYDRAKRLARNEAIRQQNKARAAANALRPPRYLTTVRMDGCKPELEQRQFCPACSASITTTDLNAGRCTNCGVELSES